MEDKHIVILEEANEADESLSMGQELPFSMTTVLEDASHVPEQYSTVNNLYKRKKTTFQGISGTKNAKSEYHIAKSYMQDKTKKRSIMQHIDWGLLQTCSLLIHIVDKVVPEKYNPREQEAAGTLWGRKLRENLLDRGKHTRRIAALCIFLLLGFSVTFIIGIVPWRTYLASDIIPHYQIKGENGAVVIIKDVMMPHYLDPMNDPSDRLRLAHIVSPRNVFRRINQDDLKKGYAKIRVEYVDAVNVSFDLLEDAMKNEADYRKLGCLCAAHMGVPINVIWMYKKGFYYEPKMTLGTEKVGFMGPVKNTNLYYNASEKINSGGNGIPPSEGFYIGHPAGIALRHVTKKGLRSDELYGKNAGCVVFCCELAAKESLVGGVDQGGVLLSKDGNVKKLGFL